jgi:hypothetical protein
MTELDPDTKARIRAEERYRVELRQNVRGFPAGMLLGILGGLLTIGGVFLPAISFPLVGSMNLLGNGERDGKFLIMLGLLTVLLALFRHVRQWLLFPGVLAGGVLYLLYSNISQNMPSSSTGLGSLVQLQYGWIVIAAGVLATLGAAFVND